MKLFPFQPLKVSHFSRGIGGQPSGPSSAQLPPARDRAPRLSEGVGGLEPLHRQLRRRLPGAWSIGAAGEKKHPVGRKWVRVEIIPPKKTAGFCPGFLFQGSVFGYLFLTHTQIGVVGALRVYLTTSGILRIKGPGGVFSPFIFGGVGWSLGSPFCCSTESGFHSISHSPSGDPWGFEGHDLGNPARTRFRPWQGGTSAPNFNGKLQRVLIGC